LTTKALLGTNDQTVLRRKIFSLTVKLVHKLKSKGKLEKKGLKVKVGQLFLRSKVGAKIFDYADI